MILIIINNIINWRVFVGVDSELGQSALIVSQATAGEMLGFECRVGGEFFS